MQWKGMNMAIDVKTIGLSGQISLGKQHAGRTVTVEEIEKGVWMVKAAKVIPENELWIHSPSSRRTLDRAVAWAAENPPRASDLNKLEAKLKKRR
jgi:hypothetical protein